MLQARARRTAVSTTSSSAALNGSTSGYRARSAARCARLAGRPGRARCRRRRRLSCSPRCSRSSRRSRTAARSSASCIAPEGATIDYIDTLCPTQIEDDLAADAGGRSATSSSPASRRSRNGISFVAAEALGRARRASSRRSSTELAPKLTQLPGVLAFADNPPSLGQNARLAAGANSSSRPRGTLRASSASYVDALLAEARKSPSADRTSTPT